LTIFLVFRQPNGIYASLIAHLRALVSGFCLFDFVMVLANARIHYYPLLGGQQTSYTRGKTIVIKMDGYNLKQTNINSFPKEWKIKRVSDLFKIETGTTPSTKRVEYWKNGNVNWITPTDLSRLHVKKAINNSERKITYKALKDINLTLLPKNSLILSTRAPVGYVALVEEPSTFNQGCKGLINKNNEKVFSEFYCYYFLYQKQRLQSLSGGSTFKELSKPLLTKFHIPLPPLPEQKKIAEILSTVDQAIEKVDEAIKKTERFKKALMQQLLTKGIGHKEFKKTKIGVIPKCWEFKTLNEVCSYITDGSHFSPKEAKNSDYRIATVANIKGNQIDIGSCKTISKEDYNALVKNGCKPQPGDVLFTKDGTVGLTFCYKQNETIVLLSSIAIIRPKNELYPDYCANILKAPFVFRQILSNKRGTGLRRIILQDLKRIRIPLPPLQEQKKISNILSIVTSKLELLKDRRSKLENIKKALMNDLLTGKKRVKLEA